GQDGAGGGTTPDVVAGGVVQDAAVRQSTELRATDDDVARSSTRVHPPALAADPLHLDLGTVHAGGLTLADRQAGLLSSEVPSGAAGALVVVAGSGDAPHPERQVRAVRVEVEAGLDVDITLFARTVMDTLNDPRGWGADGWVSFARTDG